MKKEYIKPVILVYDAEPPQLMAVSQGDDGYEGALGGAGGTDMEGKIEENDDDAYEGGSLSKRGLWDDLYW